MPKRLPAELHCHTNHNEDINVFFGPFADSTQTAEEIIDQCLKKGIKILAVTDHDSLAGYYDAKAIIESRNLDIILIPGAEISARGCHILAYNIKEIIPKKLSPLETINRIHEQGGLAFAAHPFMPPYFLGLKIFTLPFDGIEGLNASIPMLPNLLCSLACFIFAKKYISTSDSHEPDSVGDGRTCFPSSTKSKEEVLNHLKSGKFSIVFHHSSYTTMFYTRIVDAIKRWRRSNQATSPSFTFVRTPSTKA